MAFVIVLLCISEIWYDDCFTDDGARDNTMLWLPSSYTEEGCVRTVSLMVVSVKT